MTQPQDPKLYHIIHLDKMPFILADEHLLCDSIISQRANTGTTIGMGGIKTRRLATSLTSHPGLCVGSCVPFYFCPRSVMLFMIARRNPKLDFQDGQDQIIHLEFDLRRVAAWAEEKRLRWAFTLSNAGSAYFEDRCDLSQLDEIDWSAVATRQFARNGPNGAAFDGKQAEFLVENRVPWSLVDRIGLSAQRFVAPVSEAMQTALHRPQIEICRDWYY